MGFRQEVEKIWSRVNENMGSGDLGRAQLEIQTLIVNLMPRLEERKKDLEEFLKDLDEKYAGAIEVVNQETMALKPLDRNNIRAIRYRRLAAWKIDQQHKKLSEIIAQEGLIPVG